MRSSRHSDTTPRVLIKQDSNANSKCMNVKTVQVVHCERYVQRRKITDLDLKDELSDWTIIKAQDSSWKSAGFGAVAIKKGHDIIIGYRGFEADAWDDYVFDWAIADAEILFSNNNVQVPLAKKFTAEIMLEYNGANAYVTGHSLGGFLAQVISYEIIDKQLYKYYLPFTSNRKTLKDILDKKSYFKKGVTFNAAPFLYRNYSIPFMSAIPLLELKSSKYNDKYLIILLKVTSYK